MYRHFKYLYFKICRNLIKNEQMQVVGQTFQFKFHLKKDADAVKYKDRLKSRYDRQYIVTMRLYKNYLRRYRPSLPRYRNRWSWDRSSGIS